MRAIVQAPIDINDWFRRGDSNDVLRLLANYSLDKMVIANSGGSRRELLESIKDSRGETAKQILESFIEKLPARWDANHFQPDFKLGGSGAARTTIDNLEEDGRLRELSDRRSYLKIGDSRELRYRDSIEPFVKLAKTVITHDPYVGQHLIDPRALANQKLWWFEQLLDQPFLRIRAVTTVDAPTSTRKIESRNLIGTMLEKLIIRHPDFQGSFRIDVYQQDSKQFHNRTIAFEFDNNRGIPLGFAVGVENSMDLFRNETIERETQFFNRPADYLKKTEDAWKRALKPVGTILWRQNNILSSPTPGDSFSTNP